MSFYSNVLFSIFYVISGTDDRGNPIPCIDVNKLIDWMVWETWLHFHFFKSGEVIISFGLRTTFFRYQLWLPRMTKSGKLRKRQLYHFLTSVHLLCFCFLLMFNTFFRYACTGVLVATPLGGNCYTKLNSSAPLTHPLPQPPPPPPQKTESLWSRKETADLCRNTEVQKFQNENASLPRSGQCFWLVVQSELVEAKFPCCTTKR